jgi:hypothetical protein
VRIVIVAAPDPRRPIAALRHVSRWVFRSFYAVGLVVLALGVAGVVFLRDGDQALNGAVIVIGLLLLAAPSFMIASVRRQHRASAGMTIEYEIADDGLVQRYDQGESHLSWTEFERAEIFKATLLLFRTRNQYIPIPLGDVRPAHRAELHDLLEQRGLLRADPSRADLWTPSDREPR